MVFVEHAIAFTYFISLWTRIYNIEVITALGALSKNFIGIGLDWPVTLGSVTLVRVNSARGTSTRLFEEVTFKTCFVHFFFQT